MGSKRKKELGRTRLAELKVLGVANGVEVRQFSAIHCRIFGPRTVDYWPTTGRAWVIGVGSSMRAIEPVEAMRLAMKHERVVEEAEALNHMRSIVQDDSVPW